MTPPPRDKVEPLRDIPGLRRKERTWRDEVQERVRTRRKKRAHARLPLFDQPEATEPSGESAAPVEREEVAEPTPPAPVSPSEPTAERASPWSVDLTDSPALVDTDFEAPRLSDEELADLPLRSADPQPSASEPDPETPPVVMTLPSEPPGLDEELVTPEDEDFSLTPSPPELNPLERPAHLGERAQAAGVDAGILVVLGALVVYFTGRAARVDVVSLTASWPWLVSYLAFLGLFYAGYFTGTTGQTPGKMMTGLRVVDARGRPPGYLRSAARAMIGAVGAAAVGLGLIPMALDPARRALHDRLLQTRVVHR